MNRQQRRTAGNKANLAPVIINAAHYLAHIAAPSATGATVFMPDGTRCYISVETARTILANATPKGGNAVSATQRRLEEGVKAIQQEAGGVLGIDVIRQEDTAEIIACAASGDDWALTLLKALGSALTNIDNAPHRSLMLCASCSRPLKGGRFAVAVVTPGSESSEQALALAVCTQCATTVPAITAKAAGTLRSIWPDLRHVTIGAGGHA